MDGRLIRMAETRNIRELIEPVIRKHIAPAALVEMEIKEDVDHDGDPVLRILVALNAAKGRPNRKRNLRLTPTLRNLLHARQNERFPILTYMSPEEPKLEAA